MKIAIFGTGGVGGYFGARLAQAGQEVIFIARGEHLRAIRGKGLRLESILGDFTVHPARATDDPSQIGTVDLVILGVKAWQVPEAAGIVKPLLGAQTVVLPLQNGVDAPSQLVEALGHEHVLGGLCRISVLLAAPGVIRHVAIPPVIAFGELDARPSARVESLRQVFNIRQSVEPASVQTNPLVHGAPPAAAGPLKGKQFDLYAMRSEYWRAMKWDPQTGYPLEVEEVVSK